MNTHISPHNSHSWLQGKSLKGTLSDFDSHQERRLSSLEAQLGRQQDDMVNKINVLWKVFFEKLDDTSTCNTAGDSMAHVNATSTDQIRRKITRKVEEKAKDEFWRKRSKKKRGEEEDLETLVSFPQLRRIPQASEDHKKGSGSGDGWGVLNIDFTGVSTDRIPPFIIGGNDDDNEKTHYSDNLNLGPEYKYDESGVRKRISEKRTKNQAKNDKTEHGMKEREKTKSKSKSKAKKPKSTEKSTP
ncbi:hypothetical protein Tco_1531107 [Tanacetum coccineum]